ncbi:Septin-domain-containing protein [Zopfochytrium polystomum]|nr:Septin-domain-containing protein [Zopfochytrium polystomum]
MLADHGWCCFTDRSNHPANPDEIRISIGDSCSIIQSYDDGWAMARNVTTGELGLVPRNFLSADPIGSRGAPVSPMEGLAPQDLKPLTRVSSISKADTVIASPAFTVTTTKLPSSTTDKSSGAKSSPSKTKAGSPQSGSTPAPPLKSTSALSFVPGTPLAAPFAADTSFTIKIDSRPPSTALSHNPNLSISSTSSSSSGIPLSKAEAVKKLETVNASRAARAKVPANIGALKIAIAGDSGIGKTTMVKTFFNLPEVTSQDKLPSQPFMTTPHIADFRASTIPPSALYTGEDPMNLTIVDTPGFGAQMDAIATIEPVVSHHLARFQETDKNFEKMLRIPNLSRFLSAGSGAHGHIDVCIYGILHRLKPVDLEFMRRLAPVVNLVPVIVKCDTLKPSEISNLKLAVLEEISRANITIYGFGLELDDLKSLARNGVNGAVPFAISNHTIMPGGSINEFPALKDAILYHHADDLRLLTADRFVKWRDARMERDLTHETRERELRARREREEAERRAAEAEERRIREMRDREQREREQRERELREAEQREREAREREQREREEQLARQQASQYGTVNPAVGPGYGQPISSFNNQMGGQSSGPSSFGTVGQGGQFGGYGSPSFRPNGSPQPNFGGPVTVQPQPTQLAPQQLSSQQYGGQPGPAGGPQQFGTYTQQPNSQFNLAPQNGQHAPRSSSQWGYSQGSAPPAGSAKKGFGIIKKN